MCEKTISPIELWTVVTRNLNQYLVLAPPPLSVFKSRLNNHWHNHPYKFKAACYLTNQETEGKQMSTSVQISHEDLVDVEVQFVQ